MKFVFLLAAFAVILGVSAGLSLGNSDLLQKLRAKIGKAGEGAKPAPDAPADGSSGDGERLSRSRGTPEEFSAMLAYSTIASKCELVAHFITGDLETMTEEIWNATAAFTPAIAGACPRVQEFLIGYEHAPESIRKMMESAMVPHTQLLQCANLFAEMESMRLIGFTGSADDGSPRSRIMVHGQPLFEACQALFGPPKTEGAKVGDDLKKVEEAASVGKRQSQFRSLFKQLEEALRK